MKKVLLLIVMLSILFLTSPKTTEVQPIEVCPSLSVNSLVEEKQEIVLLNRGTEVSVPVSTEPIITEVAPVEAQIVIEEPTIDYDTLYELGRIIFFEARGLSWDGKLAVGQVIVNRSNMYGYSIPEIIHQKTENGTAFFSPTILPNYYDLEVSQECIDAAAWLLEGNTYFPVGDAIYFCTVTSYNNWNWHYEYVNFSSGYITLNSEGHIYIR